MIEQSMRGRICLITGTARGMGRIAARELALLGARLILVDIKDEEGRRTRDEIAELTSNDQLEFVHCDVSSFTQVRSLAGHVLEHYDKLHVLINNAGVVNPVYGLSEDGFEQHMAVHHLGHFLLTRLLLDRMKESAAARVVMISSDGHKAGGPLNWDDMECRKPWGRRSISNRGAFAAYQQSKLAMTLTTYELARRMEGSGVTVNAISPGYFIKTTVYDNMRGLFRLGCKLLRPFFNDPERSVKTYVYMAASSMVANENGKYWEHLATKESSPASYDRSEMKRLWDWSEQAVGLDPWPEGGTV